VLDKVLKVSYNTDMIKLKHTKKTDFQDTLNLDSKSQLAKLLATENITIEHNNVATASFDVANRVLTLPIFKVKNKHVYDMLITHEAGHALHTHCDDWSEIGKDEKLRMAVNVLEDTRIDKLMQSQYPGVIEDYKKGFDVLNDSNFYSLDDNNINDLSILDKINMRSKSLDRLDIDFSDEELEWVKKTDNIKSFDDVLKLAKEIIAYQEKKEEEQLIPNFDSVDNPQGGDNQEADEQKESNNELNQNSENDSEDESEDDSDSYSDNSSKMRDEDKFKEDEKDIQTNTMSPQNIDDDFGITNREFEKAVQDKLAQTSRDNKRTYGNMPKPNLKNIIIDYKQWFKDFGNDIDRDSYKTYKSQMMSRYKSFKNDSMKTVNYLVKEFEMKKSATAYRRATTSKTGIIDPMLLSKYKFSDDIFKKLSIIPDAKNHGMIILVDWSGSMSSIISPVIQQLMNLTWFCRKINIPFEVYAFSNYYGNKIERTKSTDNISFNRKVKDIKFQNFNLINFLSHRMSNKDFEKGMLNMYLTIESYDYRSYNNNPMVNWHNYDNHVASPIIMPNCMQLGSTPLNAALASMIEIIPMFKQKYGIEKLSFITLTDGASDSGEGVLYEGIDWKGEEGLLTNNLEGQIVINIKGKNYTSKRKLNSFYGSEKMTALLLQIIKERYDTNNIGFFLLENKSRRHLNYAMESYDERGNYIGADVDTAMKDLTKHNVHLTPKIGYDKYFITVGNTKVQSADLSSLNSDAKTSDIKKLFRNSMKGRLKSRVLLNNFIEEVA